MNLMRNWLLGGLVAVSLLAPAARAQEDIDLSPKLVKGDEKSYVASVQYTRVDESMGTGVPEADRRASQESTLEVTVLRRVMDKTENEAVVELVFNRIKLSVRNPSSVMEFDSEKPATEDGSSPLAAALRPMIDSIVTLRVGNDGSIKSIQRPTELEGTVASGSMVTQIMGDEPVHELFGPMFAPKPPPVKVKSGDTWTRIEFVPIGQSRKSGINVKRTDTLSSVSQGQAVIDVKGILTMKIDPTASDKLPDLKDSKLEGTIVWDYDAGLLRAYDVSQMIRVEGSKDDMTMSTRNESQTSVRLVD